MPRAIEGTLKLEGFALLVGAEAGEALMMFRSEDLRLSATATPDVPACTCKRGAVPRLRRASDDLNRTRTDMTNPPFRKWIAAP